MREYVSFEELYKAYIDCRKKKRTTRKKRQIREIDDDGHAR